MQGWPSIWQFGCTWRASGCRGEAQKINRIMESFGKHYHEQCPDLFRNADAVYILGYSVILLNTDQHNVGVGALTKCLRSERREENSPASGGHCVLL